MVQPSPCEVVPQTGRKAAAGGSPYLGHPCEVAAAGGPSRPHRHATAPAAPARLDGGCVPRSAEGVATCEFGRRRVGGVHGPSAGPRRPTTTWAGRSSYHGHAPRCAPREGRSRGHSARVGGGGPVTRRDLAVAVPNGRSVVTLALMLGSQRNKGWRAVRRGHAGDAATWFVSFGRVWRVRGGRDAERLKSAWDFLRVISIAPMNFLLSR